jgi:hypothetical protein
MRYRPLPLLIALYLSLDLTNPFVGCAFNFSIEESMEGVSHQHERRLRQTGSVEGPVRPRGEIAPLAQAQVGRLPRARPLAEWFVDLRQSHGHASDPQSSTEDH